MIDRRRFLMWGAGGAGALGAAVLGGAGLVEAEVLPGKIRLDRALGRCGDVPAVPDARSTVREGTFRSAARGREVRMVIATPTPQPRGLPVVIALHGNGGTARDLLNLKVDRYLAKAVADGVPPFALVGVDGGETYWHRRANGDDPQKMITDEVLPRLAREGMRTGPADRIGLLGWSMGGYGALLTAAMLGPGRVAAVAASSPAIFGSYARAHAANARAYDDAADFDRNDLMRMLEPLSRVPAWIDCGRSDPFAPMVTKARGRLHPTPEGGMFEGCHDGAHWTRHTPGHLAFLGRHFR
ncbi:alpha/beta hydrolase [Actinomadura barringtoniae]|uniref:Acyl-CoA:diacylglycerol acyltransferase n=1 Tax=Actinomadura barringtoniae TaxID=1427535 RepID=A0A939PN46_9ACTN|nr:alpha/beta hydrolase-fold protein [Actinomadura barringtoniae]MBO2455315.1 alpha/beta hydrolase [Actinomadura barringtoniae]